MKMLRTPDERFAGLPDFPFGPHYSDIANAADTPLRLHHLDEGRRDAALSAAAWRAELVLPLPQNDPAAAANGHRVLAPDLIGFGRSDKPAVRGDYTFERHVDWMTAWILGLDLNGITLFCQDWGGLIGLRLVARFPERFVA